MIGRLNHIAIAVPDLEKAVRFYCETLGASVSEPLEQREHGVTVVFVELPNTKVELLFPLGDQSPIKKFLERNPRGGLHHVCYEVEDIDKAVTHLKTEGLKPLGDVKPGAHGRPVVFLHPTDSFGTLIELEEV